MVKNVKWDIGCMMGERVVSGRQIAEYLQMPYYDRFVLALAYAEINYYSYKNSHGELDEVEEMYFELTTTGRPKDIWMTLQGVLWGLRELRAFPKSSEDPLWKLIDFLSEKDNMTGRLVVPIKGS